MPTPPCTRPKRRAATGTRCSTRPCAGAQSCASPWRASCARPCPATSSRCTTNPSSSPPAGDRWAPRRLLRWHHPTDGLVPPLEFIPVAEDSGLIKPVGRWVFEQAVSQLASLGRRKGRPVPRFSRRQPVRPPARRLGDPRHGPRCCSSATGSTRGRICAEVTESVVMADSAATRQSVGRLQGARVAGGYR